MNYYKLQS